MEVVRLDGGGHVGSFGRAAGLEVADRALGALMSASRCIVGARNASRGWSPTARQCGRPDRVVAFSGKQQKKVLAKRRCTGCVAAHPSESAAMHRPRCLRPCVTAVCAAHAQTIYCRADDLLPGRSSLAAQPSSRTRISETAARRQQGGSKAAARSARRREAACCA